MLTTSVLSLLCGLIGFGIAWRIRGQRESAVFAREARTDFLTGLRNRRAFQEELARQFAQRQRQSVHFSLIMIDIDQFKVFNDHYGHLAGDLALRSVAKVLTATIREMDLICRFGGDEFAVICPGSNLHEAAVAAERARQAVAAQSLSLKHVDVKITVSLGLAEVTSEEVMDALIQRADDALYSAKSAGRDRVSWHNGIECVSAARS